MAYTRDLSLPVVGFCCFCMAFSFWKDQEPNLKEYERIPPTSKRGPWLSYSEKPTERPISCSHASHRAGRVVLLLLKPDARPHPLNATQRRKSLSETLGSDVVGKKCFSCSFPSFKCIRLIKNMVNYDLGLNPSSNLNIFPRILSVPINQGNSNLISDRIIINSELVEAK